MIGNEQSNKSFHELMGKINPARAIFIALLLMGVNLLCVQARPAVVSAAEDANVGFKDMEYKTSGVSDPTGQKPQSKLWYNDGKWWGDFYAKGQDAYHIFVLDWQTQVWTDTGVALDDRENSWADVLWDGTYLYVASGTTSGPGRLYRYTYDANPSDGKHYKLSAGFPITVTDHGMEAIVLDKDSTGKLWITYTKSSKVYVAHSDGSDSTWISPYVLPVAGATGLMQDDISSIVAYDGHIGVMWSNQSLNNIVFAAHVDGENDSQWQSINTYTLSADDHINLKSLRSDSAGNVFAVVKTSFSNVGDPAIVLLACTSGDCRSVSNWEGHTVYTRPAASQRTRPILLLDTDNREVYVFMGTTGGGPIRYKKSSIDLLNFPSNGEEIFIDYSGGINDPTSTKQNVSSATGLVVAASDGSFYYHNCMNLTEVVQCPDPNPASQLSFSATAYSAAEDSGTTFIEVERVGSISDVVTVDVKTSDGTATSSADYTAVSKTITFSSGEQSKNIEIDILNDGHDEFDETVQITLSNPVNVSNPGNGAELGTPSSSVLTIIDDEEPSVNFSMVNYEVDEGGGSIAIEVVLDIHSVLPIDVDYETADDTAVAGSDYETASGTLNFAPGETSKSFNVSILEDDEDEATETVNLTLHDSGGPIVDEATLSIMDNEPLPFVKFETEDFMVNENDGEATVFVTLSKEKRDEVSITYATTGEGTATAGEDYLPVNKVLTFEPGETQKSFTVTIFNNGASESSETIELSLSNPLNAELGAPDTAVLTILDDDVVPSAQFKTSLLMLNEGVGDVTIEVSLSDASAKPITVDYDVQEITAEAGKDFEGSSGVLTFEPGETVQSFSLKILDDSWGEMNENLQFSLTDTTNAEIGEPMLLQIIIVDNDSTHLHLPFISTKS